jgi:hypothetical protein
MVHPPWPAAGKLLGNEPYFIFSAINKVRPFL